MMGHRILLTKAVNCVTS